MSETFDPYYKWLGIPPAEQPPNHYRLLGIRLFESDRDVIGHAADRQMAHLRTLQGGQHAAITQRLLNEISQARVILLHQEKKRAYDLALQDRIAAPPLPAAEEPPESEPVDLIASRVRSPRVRSLVARRAAARWRGLALLALAAIVLVAVIVTVLVIQLRGR